MSEIDLEVKLPELNERIGQIKEENGYYIAGVRPIHVNELKQLKFYSVKDKIVQINPEETNLNVRRIFNIPQDIAKMYLENPILSFVPDFIRNISIRFENIDTENLTWEFSYNDLVFHKWKYDEVCKAILPIYDVTFCELRITGVPNSLFKDCIKETPFIVISYDVGILPKKISSFLYKFPLKFDDDKGELINFKYGCVGKTYTGYPELHEEYYTTSSEILKDVYREYHRREMEEVMKIEYALSKIQERIGTEKEIIEGVLSLLIMDDDISHIHNIFPYHHEGYPQNTICYITNPPQMQFIIKEEDLDNVKRWCGDSGLNIMQITNMFNSVRTEEQNNRAYALLSKTLEQYRSIFE